ncbi:membrane protein [Bacillus sp. FJAT-27916]|uniref:DUF1405 domain-containing protein n=1 Tax=Bacillaceae TaxID=186817 RepID=UPI0006710B30|nr:DUF1405 domain-containing protein [Bacillus sp. FJAT-27916]KMY44181.1 membrane protein [Bacillus sp. FJAT-27916]
MRNWLYAFLSNRLVLWTILIINILGTIYGYYWYKGQLEATPLQFLLFVPDSPTASLFFVIALAGIMMGRNFGLFEALAVVSLFKYGIWAVVMNLFSFAVDGSFSLIALMLILSHGAMALEGLLFAPYFRVKPWHLVTAAIILVHNEIIDYVFGMMPTYSVLHLYMDEIGYFTFWLSILSIGVGYYTTVRKGRAIYTLPSR